MRSFPNLPEILEACYQRLQLPWPYVIAHCRKVNARGYTPEITGKVY